MTCFVAVAEGFQKALVCVEDFSAFGERECFPGFLQQGLEPPLELVARPAPVRYVAENNYRPDRPSVLGDRIAGVADM